MSNNANMRKFKSIEALAARMKSAVAFGSVNAAAAIQNWGVKALDMRYASNRAIRNHLQQTGEILWTPERIHEYLES